jgi:TonB family protein
MVSNSLLLELDHAADAVIARHFAPPPAAAASLVPLLRVAAELRNLPRTDFRSRLKAELLQPNRERTVKLRLVHGAAVSIPAESAAILPTLLGSAGSTYGLRSGNFAASFVAHAAAIALIATSGVWMVQQHEGIRSTVMSLSTDVSPYVLPPAATRAGGGGGGGDRDKIAASKGAAPRFAREQFTPPAIVLRNPEPKLAMQPTVIGPPDLNLSQSLQIGDPLGAVAGPPSNGTGAGAGIGTGSGGGVGNGFGPGVGHGFGGGIGGGVFRVGGGVTAPRAVYAPDPEYSEEARKAKYQGTVVLWCVVGPEGRVHETRVQRSLGLGLDQKAIDAVKTWHFEPARKDGVPVAVQINIEVNFRLY